MGKTSLLLFLAGAALLCASLVAADLTDTDKDYIAEEIKTASEGESFGTFKKVFSSSAVDDQLKATKIVLGLGANALDIVSAVVSFAKARKVADEHKDEACEDLMQFAVQTLAQTAWLQPMLPVYAPYNVQDILLYKAYRKLSLHTKTDIFCVYMDQAQTAHLAIIEKMGKCLSLDNIEDLKKESINKMLDSTKELAAMVPMVGSMLSGVVGFAQTVKAILDAKDDLSNEATKVKIYEMLEQSQKLMTISHQLCYLDTIIDTPQIFESMVKQSPLAEFVSYGPHRMIIADKLLGYHLAFIYPDGVPSNVDYKTSIKLPSLSSQPTTIVDAFRSLAARPQSSFADIFDRQKGCYQTATGDVVDLNKNHVDPPVAAQKGYTNVLDDLNDAKTTEDFLARYRAAYAYCMKNGSQNIKKRLLKMQI